jgi:hypothetical protein
MTTDALFFDDIKEITTEKLYQYDIGQKLKISGFDINENTEVHFKSPYSKIAKIATGTLNGSSLTVVIPDEFLESAGNGKVWVCSIDENEVTTIRTINIPVVERAKPDGYVSKADGSYRKFNKEIADLNNNKANKEEVSAEISKAKSEAIETASAKMIAKDSLLDITTSINLTSLEDTEQIANGVTISVSNNKITLSGTSTAAVNFYLKLKRAVTLEQGKAYCLSLQNFANIANNGCVFYPANSQKVISSSWLLSEVSAFKNAVATYTATTSIIIDAIKVAIATDRIVDNACNLQIEQNNKSTAYANPDLIKSSIKPELYQAPDHTMHYLYVSNDYDENTDDFGVTKFNSILSANDSISDNSYRNRYTIIVMAGTYTDMQDRYAGLSDVKLIGYRGVMMKDYVYYESENIYNPQATIIKWDGATGFDKSTLKSEDIIKKCPFHLDLNVHTHIKGFTFDCKNMLFTLKAAAEAMQLNGRYLIVSSSGAAEQTVQIMSAKQPFLCLAAAVALVKSD